MEEFGSINNISLQDTVSEEPKFVAIPIRGMNTLIRLDLTSLSASTNELEDAPTAMSLASLNQLSEKST